MFTYRKYMKNSILVLGPTYLVFIPPTWEVMYFAGRVDSMEYEHQMQSMWQTMDDVVQAELLGVGLDEFDN
jgi:hypothetical protein